MPAQLFSFQQLLFVTAALLNFHFAQGLASPCGRKKAHGCQLEATIWGVQLKQLSPYTNIHTNVSVQKGQNIRILTHSKATATEGCVHRKAGKVTGLIFVSKELLEFLSGLESIQFISSIFVGIAVT